MLESLLDNITNVIVRKSIINILSRLTIADKITLAKNLQLMGNRGLGHSKQVGNITDAHGLAVDGEKYADSRRIAKHLEEVGQIVKSAFIGHLFPFFLNNIAVYLLALAGGKVLFVILQSFYLDSRDFSLIKALIVEWLFNRLLHYSINSPDCQEFFGEKENLQYHLLFFSP